MSLVYRFQLPDKQLEVFSVDAGTPESAIIEHPSPFSDDSGDDLYAPGRGEITIEPLVVSSQKLASDQTVSLSTKIKGKNVAFIFVELFLLDSKVNQMFGPVFQQYIRAEKEEESGGVRYPLWQEEIKLDYTLDPVLRIMTDGKNDALCALTPERYGPSPENEHLIAGGIYSFAGGSRRRARVTFGSDGIAKQVMVFKGGTRSGAPASTAPKPGDQFTPYVKIFTLSSERGDSWEEATGLGSTLTFGNEPLRVVAEALPPGFYRAGFAVQDLDGNRLRQFAGFGILGQKNKSFFKNLFGM